jgi:alkylhydroperoxidase family enzyme
MGDVVSRPAPRIAPLEDSQLSEGAREFYAVVEGPGGRKAGTRLNAIRTLANHPELAKSYFEFGRYLLGRSTLSARVRELATLRTAWLYGSEYEWLQHSKAALRDGMTPAEIEAIKTGADAPIWSAEADRVVLRATDQLKDTTTVDDETWSTLCAHFDQKQIMDLIFTIGNYAAFAMVLGALRVDLEPQ